MKGNENVDARHEIVDEQDQIEELVDQEEENENEDLRELII